MENYKVGDKVLLKNRRGFRWNDEGKMDHYMGAVVTIKTINLDHCKFTIQEDDGKNYLDWAFEFDDIERKIAEINIKDLQFADILTLRNGERYVYADSNMYGESERYSQDFVQLSCYYNADLTYDYREKREFDIVKVERSGQIIFEREEVVEMTIQEISEKLGCEVKVVKEGK